MFWWYITCNQGSLMQFMKDDRRAIAVHDVMNIHCLSPSWFCCRVVWNIKGKCSQTSDTEKGMIFCVNHYEYLFVKKVLVEYYTIYYIKINSVLLMLTKAMKSSLFMVSHDVYRVHECLLPQIYIPTDHYHWDTCIFYSW